MRRFTFRPPLTLSGREFRGPLRGWAGKPLHPPLTDVPIGAYTFAVLLDVASYVGRDSSWAREFYRAATFALVVGACVSVFTALTGLWDWLTTEKGTQARRTANAHAWTMIVTTVVVAANIVVRLLVSAGEPATPVLPLGLSLLAGALMVLGASIGGSLVYDYGFSVENSGDHPVWHQSPKDVFPGEK